MKRTRYLIKDGAGDVRANVVLPEEEPLRLEPWMLHNVQTRGWSVEAKQESQSGVEMHGYADWRSVADNLATVLRVLLDDQHDLPPAEAEQMLEAAQVALDDYATAVMEVGLVEPDPEHDDDEGDDGASVHS